MSLTEFEKEAFDESFHACKRILNAGLSPSDEIMRKYYEIERSFENAINVLFGFNTFWRLEGKSDTSGGARNCLAGAIHNENTGVVYMGHFDGPLSSRTMECNPKIVRFLHEARQELGDSAKAIFRGLTPTDGVPVDKFRVGAETMIHEYFPNADCSWGRRIVGLRPAASIVFNHKRNRLHVAYLFGTIPEITLPFPGWMVEE